MTYDEPGAIQDAFRAAADGLCRTPQTPLEGARGFLQRMGRVCGSEIQLLIFLTATIEQRGYKGLPVF